MFTNNHSNNNLNEVNSNIQLDNLNHNLSKTPYQIGLNNNCTTAPAWLSPTNGDEPVWNPQLWTANKKFNNCYAYSVNDHKQSVSDRHRKSTPGTGKSFYSCGDIITGLFQDIPGIYTTSFNCACNPGYTKIFSAVSDESEKNDFHFWRLDQDGMWSHKMGSRSPSRVDASGQVIANPETSNRHFPTHNYEQSCGFFCVPLMEKILE